MTIAAYDIGDRESVADITRAAWAGYSLDQLLEVRHGVIGGASWIDHKTNSVLAFCEASPDQVVVARIDEKTVGFATYDFGRNDEIGFVLNNAVHPDFQGRGIGSSLHRHILDVFRSRGVRIARVSTLEHDEPARHMYEKHGFREIARTIHYSIDLSGEEI